ncbi:sulfotransferase domain-containing protein [Synechococcus sp. RS9902]|uniref:sulfotransferase domain-containing protein n=1 Tax=Synechococcus sp. RS9902 TaxID=221345 RepID=UPI0016494484|nr:sulfotransferase domain-containing protein [Synechococcus sp. RS9902]
MKAGTTWLYSLLERHPQIHFTPEKEIHFLAHYYLNKKHLTEDHRQHRAQTRLSNIGNLRSERQELIRSWYNDQYLNGTLSLDWYKNLFRSSQGRPGWNADFSNLSALIDAEGWKRLRSDVSKETKAIYILREPCERLWSQYKFSGQSHENINPSDFEKEIEHFLNDPDVNVHSQYCSNLDAVCEGLGHQNVKALLFDDIQDQPEALLASVEKFLKIPARDHSSHNNLNRRINTTAAQAPPAVFRQHCAPIVARELNGLQIRGIAVPRRWTEMPH